MSSQADETPGETDPRWGKVTLARLQPGGKVQDRVRDKVRQLQAAGNPCALFLGLVAFFCGTSSCSCRIAVVLPLESHRARLFLHETKIRTRCSGGRKPKPFSQILIDPEAYDASEQKFAASLEQTVSRVKSRFVVEDEPQPSERNADEDTFPR